MLNEDFTAGGASLLVGLRGARGVRRVGDLRRGQAKPHMSLAPGEAQTPYEACAVQKACVV